MEVTVAAKCASPENLVLFGEALTISDKKAKIAELDESVRELQEQEARLKKSISALKLEKRQLSKR